ncbi:MAG: hypothetical protein Q4G50_12490 [Corynebacterium sp.]|uniref:hypothetical protein n=1 Tax=Corynebacterium sp. TaxID=1720 RepID=UPI0026DF6066|nr:hypothetical protein [Corynebacterium sp.]MDO5670804.1 hypothetical protein [Corynebacterium sp.]
MKMKKSVAALVAAVALGTGAFAAPVAGAQVSEPLPLGTRIPLPGGGSCILTAMGTGQASGGVGMFFNHDGRLYVAWGGSKNVCSDIQDVIHVPTDGEDGADGRGITKIYLDASKNLIIEYTTGDTVNLGPLPKGEDGADAAPLTIVSNVLNADGSITLVFSDGTSFVIPAGTPGTPGVPGAPGQDGDDAAPLTIVSNTLNDDGTITLVFSDGTSFVIPAGTPGAPGVPGQDGDDAAPLTIVSNVLNSDGSITLVFSDGTSFVIPAGTQGLPGENGEDGQDGASVTIIDSTVNADGSVTVEFSDGKSITIPAGTPGLPGKDGQDGTSVTITKSTVNADGSVTVEFSDGKSITIPAGTPGLPGKDGKDGQDGTSVTITKSTVNADGSVTVEFSDGRSITIPAGTPGLPGKDGQDGQDGEDGADGRGIDRVEVNDKGELIIFFTDGTNHNAGVIVGADGKDGVDGADGADGKDGEFDLSSGSSVNPRCTTALATVGIPLLAMVPIGLASRVHVPGLTPIVVSAQHQLQNFNTDLQRQSGIYDPATANYMAQINAELAKSGVNIGQVAGASVLLALGGLAAKHVADNCLPA